MSLAPGHLRTSPGDGGILLACKILGCSRIRCPRSCLGLEWAHQRLARRRVERRSCSPVAQLLCAGRPRRLWSHAKPRSGPHESVLGACFRRFIRAIELDITREKRSLTGTQTFESPRPIAPFPAGTGSWELAARYSDVKLPVSTERVRVSGRSCPQSEFLRSVSIGIQKIRSASLWICSTSQPGAKKRKKSVRGRSTAVTLMSAASF